MQFYGAIPQQVLGRNALAESLESAITHNCKMSSQITEVLWIMHTVIWRGCFVYFTAKVYCQRESERNPPLSKGF